MEINIAKKLTTIPGSRYISDGEYLRNYILESKYEKALEQKEKLKCRLYFAF